MKLGEQIGWPVKIDQVTDFTNRGKFARMYVEIELSKPLEGIFKCGLYGHSKESFPKLNPGAHSGPVVVRDRNDKTHEDGKCSKPVANTTMTGMEPLVRETG